MIKKYQMSTFLALFLVMAFVIIGCAPAEQEIIDETLPTEVEVTMQGNQFEPSGVTIAAGGTVTWINTDNVEHTVTAGTRESPTGEFDVSLNPGEEFSYTFDEVGAFEYHCTIHPGMDGTIIVTVIVE